MTGELDILIVAGETSGDLHASLLIDEFLRLAPNARFWGIGGPRMRRAGVETIADISQTAVMGLLDVVSHIPKLARLKRRVLGLVRSRKTRAAILVDYPGFNLSIAPHLKKAGVAVGYYISPQVWAWGRGRIKKISRFVDRMVCILPFERDFYKSHGVEVDYVGHPFIDVVAPEMGEREFRESLGISGEFIALLPGSRRKEVERLLPPMLSALRILRQDMPALGAVIAAAPGVEDVVRQIAGGERVLVASGLTYSTMAYARGGIVASGSATLEALILGMPAVVVYRVDPISWLLGKRFIKTPFIALANLVAGEEVYPEFIQRIDVRRVASTLGRIAFDDRRRKEIRQKLAGASRKLGEGGAARRAAEIFIKLFGA